MVWHISLCQCLFWPNFILIASLILQIRLYFFFCKPVIQNCFFSIKRLSELVQSIIKQFPYNPNLLKSQSLQRFFMEVLPIVDWGHESLRSCKALETLMGRLNRTLPKMLDTATIRASCYLLMHSYHFYINQ